jgi:hypothetical protein
VFREAEVSRDAFAKLIEAKSECRFLFGSEVNRYLDKTHEDYAWLLSFDNSAIDASTNRSELIDQKYERLQRICAFYSGGAPLFLEYLRLDIKMRYFWPYPGVRQLGDSQASKQPGTISRWSLFKRKRSETKKSN